MKKILNILVFFLSARLGFSQEVEMADNMRAEGKIYVVIAILLLILTGLFFYLFMLDRKATRLEKKVDEMLKK